MAREATGLAASSGRKRKLLAALGEGGYDADDGLVAPRRPSAAASSRKDAKIAAESCAWSQVVFTQADFPRARMRSHSSKQEMEPICAARFLNRDWWGGVVACVAKGL